jgi:ubiquinone/menaquinone biosynthesis C-methylase UbiE
VLPRDSYGDPVSDFSPRDRRLRRYWDRQADSYDRQMAFAERRFFADTRPWLCAQAVGDALEVAIGTGLNLAHYPDDVRLTGVEWSAPMLAMAQRRADDLGRAVDLRRGDARALRFADGRFDTVVCTFAMCGIPDERVALAEMARVLRPGGVLLLADHVASSAWPVRVLQGLVDAVTVPLSGEHYRRRPVRRVRAMAFTVERHERFRLGIIERFVARKPDRADR